MKRKITFLIAAFMLLTSLISPMAIRGQSDYSTDYTGNIELSTAGGSNTSACAVIISDNQYAGIKAGTGNKAGAVMISVPAGTKYLHLHVAAWNNNTVSLAVTPEGYSDNIVLTADTGISNNTPFTFNGDPSTSDYYKVITFSDALTADTDLTFTAVGGKRFVVWGVTSEEEGGTPNPSITASNVEIAYNATSGAIDYTINNPVSGGVLTASAPGYTWFTVGTVGTESIAFTCEANDGAERSAQVALIYTYNTDQTVTKNVTVTQAANPNVVDNISDITAAGTYTVRGTIVAKSTRGFIVGDGTGYVYYYNASYDQADYEVGDIVRLAGSVKVYGGVYEFDNSTNVTSATESSYVAEDPTVLTGADMDARVASTTPPQLSSYIQYEGTLAVDGTHYNINNITGANTAIGSISYPINTDEITALNGKTVKVTGYYVGISTSTYYNTMLGSIEETTSSDPNISADNVEIAYDATSGEFGFTINNPAPNGNLSVSENVDWISNATINTDNNTVTFDATVNEAATSREGIITLTYAYGDNETVTKDVTVTQTAAPVIYTSIPALFEAATSTNTNVTITFGGWVVSAVKSSNAYLTDNQGNGLIIYASNHGFQVNDVLTGTVSCGLQLYRGSAELTGITTSTEGLNVTNDGTVTEQNIAINDLSGVNTGALLAYENLTYNGTELVDGNNNTITPYNTLYSYTIESGKSYNIKGIYLQYNTIKEILPRGAEDIEEVVPTEPSITVDPATVNAPAEGADGSLAITYQNIPELISFDIQFCDAEGGALPGDDPDWIYAEITEPTGEEGYTVSYIIDANEGEARSAYFKVYTFVGDELEEVYSNIVTINQEEYVAPTYAELPFSFNGGRADIEDTDGLYQEGLGTDYNASTNPNTQLKFDGTGDWLMLQFNERPGTLTFDIKGNSFSGGTFTVQTSEDGETFTDFAVYTDDNLTNTVQNEEFTTLGENVRYIKWIYTNKGNGNVGLGNITLAEYVEPVPAASITIDPDFLTLDAGMHYGDDFLPLTYENIIVENARSFGLQFYTAEGEETETQTSQTPSGTMYYAMTSPWFMAMVSPQTGNDAFQVTVATYDNDGGARSVYFKVYAYDADSTLVYSNLATVTQAAPVTPPTPGNWVLTPLDELTSADVFVIVGDNGSTYAMPNDNGTSAPQAVSVTVVENTLSGNIAANIQWNIVITESGYVFYPAGDATNYLYITNTNNGVKVGTGDAKHFTLDNDSGYLTTTETSDQRYIGIYNSQDWRCYKSTTGSNIDNQTFAFYKKVSDNETYTTGIDACGDSEGGYYLIASPVASVTPSANNGFITSGDEGRYDLYSFDQSYLGEEWRNYKQNTFDIIASGKGYLYASEHGTTLTFEGQPYNGNGIVALSYDNNAFDKCKGWNLIGNPFSTAATITNNYYIMNPEGRNDLVPGTSTIGAMEGIFVKASDAGEFVTFEAGSKRTADSRVVLNITGKDNKLVDRAIVRFDEGGTLPKFMINENNTKVYIPQDNHKYAVVSSDGNGTMPVNFKAAEMGKYTISVDAEDVDMNYLHLIDRLTGEDINLLVDDSYSFVATSQDMESRFILSFTANGATEDADEPFAYQNGADIIVNGEGELQIFDVMGRLVTKTPINGIETISVAEKGVYVFRIVGEQNRTQKIVVK